MAKNMKLTVKAHTLSHLTPTPSREFRVERKELSDFYLFLQSFERVK